MKKLLMVFFIIILTHCSANASTTVQYNRAGVPVYVSRGAGTPTMIHGKYSDKPTGRNHFRPGVPYHTGHYKRPCQCSRTGNRKMAMTRYEKRSQYIPNINQVSKTTAVKEISRFNKNYTVQAPKTYSRNGITYYN